jgi:hypothetical protein
MKLLLALLLATMAFLVSGTVSAHSAHAQAPACAVTESQHTDGSWWLDISGTGFPASTLMYVSAATPIGTTLGNALYADSSGAFDDQSLPSVGPGTYVVDVAEHNFAGDHGKVLASCSATLPN